MSAGKNLLVFNGLICYNQHKAYILIFEW